MARDTFEHVREIIVEQLGVSLDDVKPEAKFNEDLGADSLDAVELTMTVEEAFEIEISDEDSEKLTTVQKLVDYLEARGGK